MVSPLPGAPGNPRARVWRQTLLLSAIGVAAFAGIQALPLSSSSLHHTDFAAGEKSFLEFCEPGGPQFAPVDRVRSPVTLELETGSRSERGHPARVVARLTAASGRPVGEADLLVVHTRKLHLLVVSPTLDDYHHVHPQETDGAGEFAFTFTPREAGTYRVFADFTPRVTGRALYAGARLEVGEAGARLEEPAARVRDSHEAVLDGVCYSLRSDRDPLRINETARIVLDVWRADGSPLLLEALMGAAAHLVAFDAACSGFAHLHPATDARAAGDAALAASGAGSRQSLAFELRLADPGFYRLWAQLKIDGRERFVPFGLTVQP